MTSEVPPPDYDPDEDHVLVNRHGPGDHEGPAFFDIGSSYGSSKPHHYVLLEEHDGDHAWWLTPKAALRFADLLTEHAKKCLELDTHNWYGDN